MSRVVSPYYPPRARWYAPLQRVGPGLARFFSLNRLRRVDGVSPAGLLVSLLIPGLGFYLAGRRAWGKAALVGCGFLLGVCLVALGRMTANIAFGLLLAVHASGVTLVLQPWLVEARFFTRVFCSFGILAALGGLLYVPAGNFVDAHWFTPLQINGKVVVVKKYGGPGQVRRGDWLAYTLKAAGYTQAGLGLGPVLALPGDRIRFTETALEVNGVFRPRLPHMPDSGELVVPEKHWFLWPEFDIYGHGNLGDPATVSQVILRSAVISEQQFAGKPFKRWFWRRQVPS